MNKTFFLIPFILLVFTLIPQAFAEYEDTILIMETSSGKLIFEFFPDDAPKHVENFIKLSKDGVYTDTMFHRIIDGFMIQGGDPQTKEMQISMNTWGTGNPGYTIDAEFNDIKHNRGILSMARSSDPNSAGSQFFIVHEDSHFLDGQYTVFGRIISDESFETLDRIASLPTLHSETGTQGDPQGDIPLNPVFTTITDIEILSRSEMPNLPILPEPERTHTKIMETGGGKYTNTDFGVAFNTPVGWMIQTPVKVSPDTPDIVVAGPKIGNISPTLTLTIANATPNHTDNVENFKKILKPLVQQGVITIEKEENYNVNGYDGHLILSSANFENQNEETMRLGFATI